MVVVKASSILVAMVLICSTPLVACEDAAQRLRTLVSKTELVLLTRVDEMRFPRKHIDIPDEFLAAYRRDPAATLATLLEIVQAGSARDAHVAYVLGAVRDGSTEGRQGMVFCNYEKLDEIPPDGRSLRSHWIRQISRQLRDLKTP